MQSHPSLILFHRCAPSRLWDPWKLYPCDTRRKLIRILLSRTTAREKRRENLLSKGSIWRDYRSRALLQLLKFRGWKRPPFLSLLDSCASPSAPKILFEDTRPLLHLFLPPPSVETLLTKRATIPRSIPPECPGVVFRSLGTTTVTEDVGQTSVWILQSS